MSIVVDSGGRHRGMNTAINLATLVLVLFWVLRVVLWVARAFALAIRPAVYRCFGLRLAQDEGNDAPGPIRGPEPEPSDGPHGLAGSGFFEDDGWEIPAWQVNVFAALRGIGWTQEEAHAGVVHAGALVDRGVTDEEVLLRHALKLRCSGA